MKNYLKYIFAFLLPLSAYSLESSTSTPDLSFGFHPYGGVKFGMEYYQYTEPNLTDPSGANFMDISGPMYRLSGTFGAKFNPLLKADVEIYYSQDIGQNIYNGGIQNFDEKAKKTTITPLKTKSADYYLGASARVAFILGDGIEEEWAVLYTGLGYRYLDNQVRSSYRREQSYLYMPFGLDVKFWLSRNIRLKLNGELRALLVGKNISHMANLGWSDDAHLTQKNGSGSRISLGAEFFLTKRQAITLEAFFDYWHIQKSDIKQLTTDKDVLISLLEPDNNTKVFGAQIGYSF